MMKVCPICGKNRVIFWPEHWIYRRGSTYYCSEQCMDTDLFRDTQLLKEVNSRRKDKKRMIKKDYTDLARDIVALKETGVRNAEIYSLLNIKGYKDARSAYMHIKEWCKKYAPDLYEKLKPGQKPESNMTRMYTKEEEAKPPTVKLSGPIRIQTEEPEKVKIISEQKPLKPGLRGLNNSDFEVSAIKHPIFGEFYYDQKFGMVDWRTPDGEEVSLSPKNWKELYLIIPDVMGILGVPDDE